MNKLKWLQKVRTYQLKQGGDKLPTMNMIRTLISAKDAPEEKTLRFFSGHHGPDLYRWLWYNTEFWLTPPDRQPYTYLIRDFYHDSPLVSVLVTGSLFYCLGRWWLPVPLETFVKAVAVLFVGMLLGHLWWVSPYKEKQ